MCNYIRRNLKKKSHEKNKFFDNGALLQNDISVSAGDKSSSYYIAVQDVFHSAILPGDQSRKDVLRLNGTKTYGIFKVGFSMNYNLTTKDYNTNPGFVYDNVFNTAQHVPLTSYKDYKNNPFATNEGYFNDFYPNPNP